MKKVFTTSQKAFSIIEVMIGIFVFSLGLISIYALLASSLNVNSYNRNAIIASQLAREQLEFVYNLRDTNYEKLQLWNLVSPSNTFTPWKYYKAYQDTNYDIVLEEIPTLSGSLPEGKSELSEMWNMSNSGYRICMNWDMYEYCPSILSWEQTTPFYKYLAVEQAVDELGNPITDAFLIISKVIWYKRGYHEYEIKTVITDWRRI